jgi:NAD(P)-dependent dehydrogenase (short-subunit alcohol dehydrogenase family)
MADLKNKTLIVTGASHGIGRALSLELARLEVSLVLNARAQKPLQEITANCNSLGIQAVSVRGDVAQQAVAHQMVERALQIGRFYGFVHCAGVARPGPFLWELSQEHFQEVVGASLNGAYQLVRFAVSELLKQGQGIAVFFGSGVAELAVPGLAAYCAAKAAEEHLARQLASEAPRITTIVYRPGVADTRMQKEAREAVGGAATYLRRTFGELKDRGELIAPEESAKALVSILTNAPRRFHGRTVGPQDAR